jgi:acyl carrier protein
MTRAEIFERLQQIVRDELGEAMPITPATNLLGDLQLDSVKQLELIVEIENAFEICIESDEEYGLATVAELVALVEQRIQTEAHDA